MRGECFSKPVSLTSAFPRSLGARFCSRQVAAASGDRPRGPGSLGGCTLSASLPDSPSRSCPLGPTRCLISMPNSAHFCLIWLIACAVCELSQSGARNPWMSFRTNYEMTCPPRILPLIRLPPLTTKGSHTFSR